MEERNFLRRKPIQPRAGLFLRGFRRQRARQRGAAHPIGVGADQGELFFLRRFADSLPEGEVQMREIGPGTPAGGFLRNPRRLLEDRADHPDEFLRRQTIDVGHAITHFYHCVISHHLFTIAAGIGKAI